MGLLELKAFLKSNIMHTDHLFRSWVNEARSSESWSRLENLETLNLGSNRLNRSIIKSLSAIKSLKNLNLSWNWNWLEAFPAQGMLIFGIISQNL
uniref:Uncharacterized protein n=1 Tax=Quercus lobata TaxID=97700 RepID=A0A7N2LN78_QUELO